MSATSGREARSQPQLAKMTHTPRTSELSPTLTLVDSQDGACNVGHAERCRGSSTQDWSTNSARGASGIRAPSSSTRAPRTPVQLQSLVDTLSCLQCGPAGTGPLLAPCAAVAAAPWSSLAYETPLPGCNRIPSPRHPAERADPAPAALESPRSPKCRYRRTAP